MDGELLLNEEDSRGGEGKERERREGGRIEEGGREDGELSPNEGVGDEKQNIKFIVTSLLLACSTMNMFLLSGRTWGSLWWSVTERGRLLLASQRTREDWYPGEQWLNRYDIFLYSSSPPFCLLPLKERRRGRGDTWV